MVTTISSVYVQNGAKEISSSAKSLPDKTTVISTVTGGDQEQVGNFTIAADGTAAFDRETSISGQEDASLKATVTQVIPGR